MHLNFSTKAQTLALLKDNLSAASIAPMCIFSQIEWKSNRAKCLESIKAKIGNGPWIIRSSCKREDTSTASNAGKFLSITDVAMADLETSIDQVFLSYEEPAGDDEVLIQPMLENVIRSGVAFSHDPNTCSPYRIINWSDSEDTTVVTGGAGGRIWIQAAECSFDAASTFNPIISLLDELTNKFGAVPIDCEFAITKSKNGRSFHEKLWLLQARRLILSEKPEKPADQTRRLRDIASKVKKGIRPHPLLMGKRTVYGVMPDWNPAEIIGLRPKPLALSLYRELITDSIWAYQRHNYGYRNLRSFPLMPHFHGLPYIDVRLSFNSFIPNELDNDLASRLVDYYVEGKERRKRRIQSQSIQSLEPRDKAL